ncbi:Hypothetical predicted protein [Mytilus galloprovincialis]|uniref:Uncharacterized protein n=1 Tax=Mytilus galloprovincialis TaxID=29158 RepID=A0A8B6H7N8_MYTGA|nr:Hypothetical predicted protein [Mytilus galloprovincialis]
MSKDGPKPGETTVSQADLTDNKRETSNPNELHLEHLSIAEKSDQPSLRQRESKISSSGKQELRNVNGQHANKERDKAQRQGNGSDQNHQYRKTDGKGKNATSKGNATPQGQRGKNTYGNYKKKTGKSHYEAYMTEADVKKGLDSGQLIEGPIRIHNDDDAYIPHPVTVYVR